MKKVSRIVISVLSLMFVVGILSTACMAAPKEYKIYICNHDRDIDIGDDGYEWGKDFGGVFSSYSLPAGEEADVRAYSREGTRMIDTLTIKRMDTGEEVPYTEKEFYRKNGTYVVFIMPDADVTIEATFKDAPAGQTAGGENAADKSTATAISGGQIAMIGGIGLIIGILIGAGGMAAFRKKEAK